MGNLVTMDDLTNDDIVSVLDDAERLLPVAKGDIVLPLLQGKEDVFRDCHEEAGRISAKFQLRRDICV